MTAIERGPLPPIILNFMTPARLEALEEMEEKQRSEFLRDRCYEIHLREKRLHHLDIRAV
jgi:hypothetical protein